ncbi:MAG: transglycosylase domain-containing protein [Ruthenibacterium lactatiformans]
MQHAFVAIEDKHFYEHHGVSLTRTAYAVLNEMKKALTGTYFGNGIKQGASTIDQQLIKNLTRDDEAGGLEGYMRKVREIWRAYRLDAKYDKETILEAYLNVISYRQHGGRGGRKHQAVRKIRQGLILAQCASIASITKNPYRYDPRTHEEEHLSRRNYILYEMWQQGYITEEQYNAASAEPHRPFAGQCAGGGNACHDLFHRQGADGCVRRSSEQYGLDSAETTNLLYNGGLRIYTTVAPDLQAVMENALERGSSSFFPTSGLGVATQATKYNEDGTIARDENGDPIREDVVETPQAAMVSVGYDGSLKAIVGGIGEKEVSRGLNRGTVPRQVGSTMKPIGAYALALEKNKMDWFTPLLDAPVRQLEDEKTGELKDWPTDFSKVYCR